MAGGSLLASLCVPQTLAKPRGRTSFELVPTPEEEALCDLVCVREDLAPGRVQDYRFWPAAGFPGAPDRLARAANVRRARNADFELFRPYRRRGWAHGSSNLSRSFANGLVRCDARPGDRDARNTHTFGERRHGKLDLGQRRLHMRPHDLGWGEMLGVQRLRSARRRHHDRQRHPGRRHESRGRSGRHLGRRLLSHLRPHDLG